MSESTVFHPNQTMPLRPQRGLLGMPTCETCGEAFYPRQDGWRPGPGTMARLTATCPVCAKQRALHQQRMAKGQPL